MTSGTSWHALRRALYHLGVIPGAGLQHALDQFNGSLQLLIAHLRDRAGMLDLHFPRHQERANLHVGRRLRLAHLFNRCRPVLLEVGSEREQEILVERSTGSLQGTARVSTYLAPPNRGGFNSTHIHGTSVPVGGAVHSIKSGQTHRSKKTTSGKAVTRQRSI